MGPRVGRSADPPAQYPWLVVFSAPALISTSHVAAAMMLTNTINAPCLEGRRGRSIRTIPIAKPSGGTATARM